jgi:hypothetical protein
VIYQCDILVCKTTDRTKINPTHEWLHAMDPDTYPHPQASHVKPLCRDETCMNYYQTRRVSPPCCRWPLPSHLRRGLIPPITPASYAAKVLLEGFSRPTRQGSINKGRACNRIILLSSFLLRLVFLSIQLICT